MGIVEDMGLGEMFGKAPLAETRNPIGKEQTSAIAEGTALHVVQAHGRGIPQKGRVSSGARLEVAGGIGRYSFASLEKGNFGIEGNGASEGFKGRATLGLGADGVLGGGTLRQTVQVTGGLGIRASVDMPDELNGIPTTAGRETSPEVSSKVHPEGGGIVSPVERTGTGELIPSGLEARVQPVGGKNFSDGDTVFEEIEAVGVHVLPPC